MLSSDKTSLSKHYGDKQAHCVYLSCGNIDKDVRSKATARCWIKVAEIPVVKFEETDLQGVLSQRLYHQCMDIITKTLKQCSHSPVWMTDARGDVRLVRTILLAHLADYPEQQMIACCYGGGSPLSLARTKHFGLSESQPIRNGKGTLRAIRALKNKSNPRTIRHYLRFAKASGLSGVDKPFWRDWKFADPSQFLVPDALHQWHKFFWDHIMSWARSLMGNKEVDRRYKCLQKHIQHRHFTNGFTSFSQHTMREFRELQSSFVAVIADHKSITPGIMAAFRALLDFIYLGQLETQTTDTLQRLQDALTKFHANKKHLVAAGLRNGPRQKGQFNIPKLELMHHPKRLAALVGSLPQYSTDQTESLHIPMAKEPYRASNKKNHALQVCLSLDRRDKISTFALYVEWREHRDGVRRDKDSAGARPLVASEESQDKFDWHLRTDSFLPFARAFIPRPSKNWFEDEADYTPRNDTTAFILTDRITNGNAMISHIARRYCLPKLCDALTGHFERQQEGGVNIQLIDCWDRLRLQLRLDDDDGTRVRPPVPVLALPPSDDLPYGLCNFVMVRDLPDVSTVCIKGLSEENR